MGLLSMLNFMAGAVSAGVYSKTVDQGTGINWNPAANSYPEAFVYSNIYAVLAILHIGILLLYYFQFGRAERKSKHLEKLHPGDSGKPI
jgi:DHA2 family metal-tetracycline-proton antiporter-like MFS transporter